VQARLDPGEQRQKVRPLEVLERVRTHETRRVLASLAAAALSGRPTEKTRAALGRLERKMRANCVP
jgi:hypothetical protein